IPLFDDQPPTCFTDAQEWLDIAIIQLQKNKSTTPITMNDVSTSTTTSSVSPSLIASEISLPLHSTITTTIPHVDLTMKRIKHEQGLDANIQNIVKHMINNQHYEMVDDVLYRLIPRGLQTIRLPYLPRSLIRDVLFLFHDHPSSAHFGITRTYEKLKNKCYWRNMKHSIINYIQSCLPCSKYNIRRTKPPGLMHSIETPHEILGIVGMDYWGPTNEESIHGNRLLFQQVVTANTQHQNSLAKQRFDKNRPDPQYEIGELVLIKVLDKSSKFHEQFEGPYRITEQKDPETFVVKIEDPEQDDNADYTKQVTTCDM
ncbi:unnamed protein product, partial [Didymodactylos carnosus]